MVILNTPGLIVENLDMVAGALDGYAELDVNYIAAYHALWTTMQGVENIVTYDTKHFSRLPGITAIGPEEAR